jgi:hypothetical protein
MQTTVNKGPESKDGWTLPHTLPDAAEERTAEQSRDAVDQVKS